jgi:hypothetical protein
VSNIASRDTKTTTTTTTTTTNNNKDYIVLSGENSKECAALDNSSTAIAGSNFARGMNVSAFSKTILKLCA